MTRHYGRNADDELERQDADLRAGQADGWAEWIEAERYDAEEAAQDDDLDRMARMRDDDRLADRERRR